MKYINYLYLLLPIFLLISCQDVVEVDLDEGEKQLVIEAHLDWEKGTLGNEQSIFITETMPYFSDEKPKGVSGASVSVTDENGVVYPFVEKSNGVYQITTFSPTLDMKYTLHIDYQGQKYESSAKMFQAPFNLNIQQKSDGGFSKKDIELRGYFSDIPTKTNNFYLIRIDNKNYKKPSYISVDGQFFQNNQLFFIYSDDKIKKGDVLDIKIYSVSSAYYDYINQLLTITQGGTGAGPFSTPPATIRGTIVNLTDTQKNPLGSFRATQYIEEKYKIK